MSNITINEAKRSIEVTKEFYKKASVFGSAEYYELREVRHEFPNFKIVANKAPKRDSFKGLTYDYMKRYRYRVRETPRALNKRKNTEEGKPHKPERQMI